ncbi:solute carrier family 35 member F2 isoform X4 [Lynx canadensis]|nr:solute carrier family 35 member F2 isoform X4 [Lynx canadensis]XP_030189355.1 solute carrier family 35 member F2 isoform X4 [Lynx canadensis]
MLSLCICGTAITSQYLAERYRVNTPMLQSFINYCLLLLFYTVMLAFQSGSDNLLHILKRKWWKYVLLGLADVEANYLIVRAYQYTTLTSVQLLDCFGIPVLMALSWFVLYARYRVIHLIAVAVCLLGVGTMVGADILAGREDNSGSDVLIGDILVLLGASLYAVSNVCEEYIVKRLSRQEFLGMVGLFGTIISGIQLSIVECKDIASIQWDWKIALLFVAFALCMFCLYSFMPLVIQVTSATSVNLGILTADLYSLFFGLFLFGYKLCVEDHAEYWIPELKPGSAVQLDINTDFASLSLTLKASALCGGLWLFHSLESSKGSRGRSNREPLKNSRVETNGDWQKPTAGGEQQCS